MSKKQSDTKGAVGHSGDGDYDFTCEIFIARREPDNSEPQVWTKLGNFFVPQYRGMSLTGVIKTQDFSYIYKVINIWGDVSYFYPERNDEDFTYFQQFTFFG